MTRYQAILIACPQHRQVVRGRYRLPAGARPSTGPSGEFNLNDVTCNQMEGRCMATLCALHRYNRRGPGTWYPDRVLSAPIRARRPHRRTAGPRRDGSISYHA